MNDRVGDSALELHLTGPGVSEGSIPLADLATIAEAIQKAVQQIGSIVKTGASHSGGRLSADLEAATRLELSQLSAGSVVLDVELADELPRPFEEFDVGLIAISRLVEGIGDVNSEAGTPEDWDDRVYRALRPLDRVLKRGNVSNIRIGHRAQRSTITGRTSQRISERLTHKPSLEHRAVVGRLMMVDFDADKRRCRIEQADGVAVECIFPIDLLGLLRENAMRYVEVTGYGEMSDQGQLKRLSILQIQPVQTPAGVPAETATRAIDDLIDEQQVRPVTARSLVDPSLWSDPSEVDEFLDWVQEHRDSALL